MFWSFRILSFYSLCNTLHDGLWRAKNMQHCFKAMDCPSLDDPGLLFPIVISMRQAHSACTYMDQNAWHYEWIKRTGDCTSSHCNVMISAALDGRIKWDISLQTCQSWWDSGPYWRLMQTFLMSWSLVRPPLPTALSMPGVFNILTTLLCRLWQGVTDRQGLLLLLTGQTCWLHFTW